MNFEVLSNAFLKLPSSEQVKLVRQALLNPEVSRMLFENGRQSADEYWAAEAQRRAKAIDQGESRTIPGDVVRKELAELLRKDRV